MQVQSQLKAPKSNRNNFGKYNYRSCEDILEAVKPLLVEVEATILITDEIVVIGDRFYVKATATFSDAEGNTVTSTSYAREAESKKGADPSQITGAASSYARKYALSALLLIDDTKDADADGAKPKEPPIGVQFTAHCNNCGTAYTFNDAGYYKQFIQNPGCCNSPHWVVD